MNASRRRPKQGEDRAPISQPLPGLHAKCGSSDQKDQTSPNELTIVPRHTEDLIEHFNTLIEPTFELRGLLTDLSQQKCTDRERAIIAIDIVIEFITRVVDKRDLLPFIKLRSALADLDRGVAVPMLQTKQRTNSDPSGRTVLKSMAAATMSLLMQTGVPRKESAKQVATQLTNGGMTFGDRRNSEPWRSVAAWRDQAVKASWPYYISYRRWLTNQLPTSEQEYQRFRTAILKRLLRMTRYDDRD
jgi:hypothetical protein